MEIIRVKCFYQKKRRRDTHTRGQQAPDMLYIGGRIKGTIFNLSTDGWGQEANKRINLGNKTNKRKLGLKSVDRVGF